MSDEITDYRLVPDAGVREQHSVTGKWRYRCQLDGCGWVSASQDTPAEVDVIATEHLTEIHGADEVIPTP